MTKEEFTLDSFIKAVGMNANGLLNDVFKILFARMKEDIEPARVFFQSDKWNYDNISFEEYLEKVFSKETKEKVIQAEKDGFTVYMGRLRSDYDEVEAYFCTAAFVIDTETLKIDATNSSW
ncbi:MAG: hypothetical protein K6G31_05855 [Paludibacteraceae bacterium]|nr:hypothetical protein [Paludibacteraceae bacterium]